MRLSESTLYLCEQKFGRGQFCGFDENGFKIMNPSQSDMEELIENGIVERIGDNIHFSALSQHIFRMMIEPEEYIYIENDLNQKYIRLYFLDIYYLCVIEAAGDIEKQDEKESKKIVKDSESRTFTITLLPNLDLVIGAFVHALIQEKAVSDISTFRIGAQAWDKDRKEKSVFLVKGVFQKEKDAVRYQLINDRSEMTEDHISKVINILTDWLFMQLRERGEEES